MSENGTATVDLVARVLSDITEVPVETIGPHTNLREELDVDSLATIELATLLSEETGDDFADDAFAGAITVNDVVGVVTERR